MHIENVINMKYIFATLDIKNILDIDLYQYIFSSESRIVISSFLFMNIDKYDLRKLNSFIKKINITYPLLGSNDSFLLKEYGRIIVFVDTKLNSLCKLIIDLDHKNNVYMKSHIRDFTIDNFL